MFDLGWTELLVIAMVAIIVVGPKDLPSMLRNVGQMVGRLRKMAGEFQKTFNDAVKDAEKQAGLEDIRKEVGSVRDLNPLNDLKKSIEVSPTNPGKPAESKDSSGADGKGQQADSTASSGNEDSRIENVVQKNETAEFSNESSGTGETVSQKANESVSQKASESANEDGKHKTVQESPSPG